MTSVLPCLDGTETFLLDQRVWEGLPPIGDLVDARHGGAPLDRTTVRAAAGARALHVQFVCEDRDVWANHVARDAPLWQEEVVEVFLAPGPDDPRRYAEIEMSPAGVLFDALVENPDGRRDTMTVDPAWTADGLVGRVRRPQERRWIAELAIPWAALARLGEARGSWRANFYRVERPRAGAAEFTAWSPTGAEPADFHKPHRFGLLVTP